uniref:Pentapeptide repeat-containing protein n=1 Tax=viral metagenome TaxID=1070528 RepID=A0A6C0CBW0_9ZZZZ
MSTIIKIHIFKYALWKFYQLGIYLSSDADKQLLDIVSYFIKLIHIKIDYLKIFKNVNLSNQHMRNIQLCNSHMINVDLSHTNLILEKNSPRNFFDYPPHEWNFCTVYVDKTIFCSASLSNVTFLKVFLKKVDFSNANLSSAYFIECKFEDVKFNGANLVNSMFDDCDFERNEFINADIGNGKFIYCDFQSTNFIDSNLTGSLLHNIGSWEGSTFTGCRIDEIVIDEISKILIMK